MSDEKLIRNVADIRYKVGIRNNNQYRDYVQLDSLRFPLTIGEPYEAYCKKRGGYWLPAEICGPPSLATLSRRYKVHVHDNRDTPSSVLVLPAVRIRRRFPPGSSI